MSDQIYMHAETAKGSSEQWALHALSFIMKLIF